MNSFLLVLISAPLFLFGSLPQELTKAIRAENTSDIKSHIKYHFGGYNQFMPKEDSS